MRFWKRVRSEGLSSHPIFPRTERCWAIDYPLLFDPADASEFERILLRALTDHELQSNARAEILQRIGRFDAHMILDRLETLLESSV